jgi:hypothetical protein
MHLLPAIAVTALLLPSAASAATITFTISRFGELAVSFGLLPFEMQSDARGDDLDGTITLQSGPASVFSGGGFTDYAFGPGLLTMTLSGFTENGTFVEGEFRARVLPFSFFVEECDDEDEESCDPEFPGGSADDIAIFLGEGRFDPQLAKLLGVRGRTTGGFMELRHLEEIDGGPDDDSRSGFDSRGFTELEIDAVEVPEPALALLALAAGGGWAARRRRASR